MKSDVRVWDPQKRPIYPKVDDSEVLDRPWPSRFRRKKQFHGKTASLYNEDIQAMPEGI